MKFTVPKCVAHVDIPTQIRFWNDPRVVFSLYYTHVRFHFVREIPLLSSLFLLSFFLLLLFQKEQNRGEMQLVDLKPGRFLIIAESKERVHIADHVAGV